MEISGDSASQQSCKEICENKRSSCIFGFYKFDEFSAEDRYSQDSLISCKTNTETFFKQAECIFVDKSLNCLCC